ncbi:DEAD/DEAH box helicase [bacterium]|nr:DEAD/DEAH box helicase [bacterium]
MNNLERKILNYISIYYDFPISQNEIISKMKQFDINKNTTISSLKTLVDNAIIKKDSNNHYSFINLIDSERYFLELYELYETDKNGFVSFFEKFYDGYVYYRQEPLKDMSIKKFEPHIIERVRNLIDNRDFIEKQNIISSHQQKIKHYREFVINNLNSGLYKNSSLYILNVLSKTIQDKLLNFESIDNEIKLLKSQKEIFLLFIELKRVYLLIIHYILRGDFLEAEKYLNSYLKDGSPEYYAMLGVISFFKEFNLKQASKYFRESLKDYNRYDYNYRYSLKEMFVCDVTDLSIFTFLKESLYKTITTDWYKSEYSVYSRKQNLFAFYEKKLNNKKNYTTTNEIENYDLNRNIISTIVSLFSYVSLENIDSWSLDSLKNIGKKALENGYQLIALDIFNILKKHPLIEKKIVNEAENLQKGFPNRESISTILNLETKNSKIFNLIENDIKLVENDSKNGKKEGRIVWKLDNKGALFPFVQIVKKSGEFGKLKQIAETSLNSTYREFATKVDNYISAIYTKKKRYSEWGDFYITELENFELLSEADNIYPYDENEAINQIFFENGKYPISIYEEDGEFKVFLEKNLVVKEDFDNFNIIKIDKYHYKLVELSNTTLELLRELEINKPIFSIQDFDKLQNWIQNSKTLEIDSDIYFPKDGKYRRIEHQTKLSVEIEYLGDRFFTQLKFTPYPEWKNYSIFKHSLNLTKIDENGEYLVIARDKEFEKKLLDRFLKKFIIDESIIDNPQKYLEYNQNIFEITDVSIILSILESGEKEDYFEIKWRESNKERKNIRFATTKNVVWSINNKNSWFEIDLSIELDNNERFYLKEFLKKVDSKPFVKLDSGEILVITSKLKKNIDSMRELLIEKDNSLIIPPHLAENIDKMVSESSKIESTKEWRENVKKLKNIEQMNIIIPTKIEKKLRDYQKKGVHWITKMSSLGFGLCLADDMGLGKTVQAIYSVLINPEKTVVITPASVLYNWREEIIKFAPQLNPIIYEGDERSESLSDLSENSIVIVSYDTFQRDSEFFYKIFWGWIILDEAQMIKNSETKRAKSIIKLQGERKLILSGTPIENHLGELWSLFNFLNPLLLGSQKEFLNSFVKPIIDGDELVKKILKNMLSPFILRRLKRDVLKELPEKTEKTYFIDFNAKERAFYEASRLKALEDLKNSDGANQRVKILAHLTKLRQITCDPSIVNREFSELSTKSENALNIIENIIENGHKVLVFSQFTSYLDKIKRVLNKARIEFLYIDGSISSKKRLELVDQFQNGITPVFLISLRAGGVGLNLTAANYVIHLDPWWNPAVENQATDRTHRIGQNKNVTVYKMIIRNSIEEKILKLHDEKKWLSSSILDDLDQISEKLSIDELINLLR